MENYGVGNIPTHTGDRPTPLSPARIGPTPGGSNRLTTPGPRGNQSPATPQKHPRPTSVRPCPRRARQNQAQPPGRKVEGVRRTKYGAPSDRVSPLRVWGSPQVRFLNGKPCYASIAFGSTGPDTPVGIGRRGPPRRSRGRPGECLTLHSIDRNSPSRCRTPTRSREKDSVPGSGLTR
jgi:hypothetical protein